MVGTVNVEINTYKIILVGDTNTGKSEYLRQQLLDGGDKTHTTLGFEDYPFIRREELQSDFVIRDTAGVDIFGANKSGYYDGMDAFVIFYKNDEGLQKWQERIADYAEGKPIFTIETRMAETGIFFEIPFEILLRQVVYQLSED